LKTLALFVLLGTVAFFLAASGLVASLFAPGFAPPLRSARERSDEMDADQLKRRMN
jgi:hypothetical protein